ncbi:SNO glutamine amidotransferase [Amylostereum chailletii]|nr:SNO glutamine amidotransferase [Amylostereum chailletii]
MTRTPQARVNVSIGILALQGAFAEHQAMLQKLSPKVHVVLVRTPDELTQCDALIIPGGESTTIALLARISGLADPLKTFVKTRAVWGTCAGAILLSSQVTGAKRGGQDLLGGMAVHIARNGWGSQVESFEAQLQVAGLREPDVPFTGVFIRAPVVLELTASPDGPPIEVLARVPDALVPSSLAADVSAPHRSVVALRQGRHLMTTFHPELTPDARFHEYFVRECVLPYVSA